LKMRWAKWMLLAPMLLAMPFCWSFGRDSLAIVTADADGRQDIHFHLIRQLLEADTYGTVLAARSRNRMPMTIIHASPCEVYASSSIRHNPDVQGSVEPETESISEYAHYPQLFLDRFADEQIRFSLAVGRFSPFAASALRACIEFTPFSQQCASRREHVLNGAIGDINERRVEEGTRRRVLPARQHHSSRNYCTTLPMPFE
jgi:hypothetical protein